MAFKHEHMQAGIKKAIASPKTPAHLKKHLQARLNKPAAEVQKPKPLAKKPVANVKPNAFFGGF